MFSHAFASIADPHDRLAFALGDRNGDLGARRSMPAGVAHQVPQGLAEQVGIPEQHHRRAGAVEAHRGGLDSARFTDRLARLGGRLGQRPDDPLRPLPGPLG